MTEIILYPTDTVYGLGVDATDEDALRALKALKGREEVKYFPVIVSDIEMAGKFAILTPLAKRLAAHFWPGKLTLVLMAKNLPHELMAPDGSVGIRIPNHPAPLQLIKELGKPITATSANISGMPVMTTPAHILRQFGDKASQITRFIDGGALPPSEPSTVVDARGAQPIVIRKGAIPGLALQEMMM